MASCCFFFFSLSVLIVCLLVFLFSLFVFHFGCLLIYLFLCLVSLVWLERVENYYLPTARRVYVNSVVVGDKSIDQLALITIKGGENMKRCPWNIFKIRMCGSEGLVWRVSLEEGVDEASLLFLWL